jgi:hypothetical protein
MATIVNTLQNAWDAFRYEGTCLGKSHNAGIALDALLAENLTALQAVNSQLETHATRHASAGADPLDVGDLADAGSRLLSTAVAAGVNTGNPSAGDPVAKMSDLTSIAAGIAWKNPVLITTLLTAPAHVAGERYLINGIGAGPDWTGKDYQIAESDGVAWSYEDATAVGTGGWTVWDFTTDDAFINVSVGAAWQKRFGMEVQTNTTGVTVDRAAHSHGVTDGGHAHGGVTGAGASHTHGITGATSAGASHTHGLTDGGHTHGGVTGAGASHTHGITDGGHTHGGVTGAGASHDHVFTGDPITPTTLPVTQDLTPQDAVLFWAPNPGDGIYGSFFSVTAGALDSFVTLASGAKIPVLYDANPGVNVPHAVQVYVDDDGVTLDERLLMVNAYLLTNGFVRATDGSLVKIKHDAGAAGTGVPVYFDDGGQYFNASMPNTASITVDSEDEFFGLDRVSAGDNAPEAAHTHTIASGTVGIAATDAEAVHTHTVASGTVGIAATDAEAVHTHTVPAATDAEAVHTHVVTSGTTGIAATDTDGAGAATVTETPHAHTLD